MESIVRFFDRTGVPLAELQANTIREWRLNEPGTASFLFPRGDLLEEQLVTPGVWVLIESELTPDWVGRITDNRKWVHEGVTVEAKQAEIILEDRAYLSIAQTTNTLVPPPILTGTAEALIRNILDLANGYEDTLIRAGSMFTGGQNRQETLTQDFLSHLRFIVNRTGYDYEILPVISAGNLSLVMNVYEDKGIDTSVDFELEEGINIELTPDNILLEQTRIVNRLVGIGEGANDENRLAVMRENAASRNKYGLRMDSEQFSGVTQLATLQSNTEVSLADRAVWHKTIPVSCNDPVLFPRLMDGNWVRVILHSYGFLDNSTIGTDVRTRILSAEIEDARATMSLVLKDA